MASKVVPNLVCPGCGGAVDPNGKGQAAVSVVADGIVTSSTYCPKCSPAALSENLDQLIRRKLTGEVSISEPLVREIAGNLGASPKLTDALVEKVFGKGWTGDVPRGAIMNRYTNRDRLVAFVAANLKDLWTLEA